MRRRPPVVVKPRRNLQALWRAACSKECQQTAQAAVRLTGESLNASSSRRVSCVRLVSCTEKNMKTRSHAIDVIAALACLGGSWSCGGRDSPSGRTGQVGSAQMHAAVPATPAHYQSGSKTSNAQKEECSPIGVKRKDSFLHVKSTLPRSLREWAALDVHRVSPLYGDA